VQFILRHEREHTLRFAALESELGRSVRARHPELAATDSMIWVDEEGSAAERVRIRSAAGLHLARYLGGPWKLTALGYLVPRPIRDAVYDLIARHRHALVRAPDHCFIPPPAVRQRFL
jgi:predicted DCC family thiol-disulfide oxidoreductase YuxK